MSTKEEITSIIKNHFASESLRLKNEEASIVSGGFARTALYNWNEPLEGDIAWPIWRRLGKSIWKRIFKQAKKDLKTAAAIASVCTNWKELCGPIKKPVPKRNPILEQGSKYVSFAYLLYCMEAQYFSEVKMTMTLPKMDETVPRTCPFCNEKAHLHGKCELSFFIRQGKIMTELSSEGTNCFQRRFEDVNVFAKLFKKAVEDGWIDDYVSCIAWFGGKPISEKNFIKKVLGLKWNKTDKELTFDLMTIQKKVEILDYQTFILSCVKNFVTPK